MAANGVKNGSSSPFSQETSTETVTVKRDQPVIEALTNENGGSYDSSSSVTETVKLNDVVSLTKEEDVEEVTSFSKPVKGLHEIAPTPFLRKTFEIVDDEVTDPVISWSPTRKSFIIWDSYRFSENLLPKYFKHKNFSSFIRQLNTYGFKKVDSDKWEFANEGFEKGSKHLLKNIKRKRRSNCTKDVTAIVKPLETMTELEALKKDHSSLESEILNLKQQQEESHHQMINVQEKINGVETKQLNILSFFTKLAKDEKFAERLMKKRKEIEQEREIKETDEFVKKLKLLQSQENLPDMESGELDATEPKPLYDILMNDEFMSDVNADELNLMTV